MPWTLKENFPAFGAFGSGGLYPTDTFDSQPCQFFMGSQFVPMGTVIADEEGAERPLSVCENGLRLLQSRQLSQRC
jgi:hypothetical protein